MISVQSPCLLSPDLGPTASQVYRDAIAFQIHAKRDSRVLTGVGSPNDVVHDIFGRCYLTRVIDFGNDPDPDLIGEVKSLCTPSARSTETFNVSVSQANVSVHILLSRDKSIRASQLKCIGSVDKHKGDINLTYEVQRVDIPNLYVITGKTFPSCQGAESIGREIKRICSVFLQTNKMSRSDCEFLLEVCDRYLKQREDLSCKGVSVKSQEQEGRITIQTLHGPRQALISDVVGATLLFEHYHWLETPAIIPDEPSRGLVGANYRGFIR